MDAIVPVYSSAKTYLATVQADENPWPIDQILARAELQPPGAFAYPNIGCLLVRLALEPAHGGSFFDIPDRLVLSPLGVEAAPFTTRDD